MASYLSMAMTQRLSVARAQCWNSAIVVAEAGVEEAMAHLNSGIDTNNLAVNSWTDVGSGNYRKTNFLGTSYSVVTIQIPPAVTNTSPVVVSTGYVRGPISTPMLSRTVRVATRHKPLLNIGGALVVLTLADFAGQGISTDSFDSSNTNYSTGGLYDPNKALDHGDVVSLAGTTDTVVVGNGQVKGSVHTAPGGTASVGSNGSVGDSNWVDNATQGIQAGHFQDDVNYPPPEDVTLPNVAWSLPLAGKYKIKGTTYQYILDNSSAWKLSALKGASVYVDSKDVMLYVTDEISEGSGTVVYIAPGASLKLFVGAPKASFSGQGIVNATGQSQNFIYYGLPTNTAFDLGGNSAFIGCIYAPEATFTLGGGGSSTYDFIGYCLSKAAKLNGHFHFHYDENLQAVPASHGYAAISWDEL